MVTKIMWYRMYRHARTVYQDSGEVLTGTPELLNVLEPCMDAAMMQHLRRMASHLARGSIAVGPRRLNDDDAAFDSLLIMRKSLARRIVKQKPSCVGEQVSFHEQAAGDLSAWLRTVQSMLRLGGKLP